MSAISLSPTQAQLPFLPHAPPSRSSRTPPGTYIPLPTQITRRQSSTASTTAAYASRSAPSSPSSRPRLMPLSAISSTQLDQTAQIQLLPQPQLVAQAPIYTRQRSMPLSTPVSPVEEEDGRRGAFQHIHQAQASRARSRGSTSGTDTEVDSDTTFVPGRNGTAKNRQSQSQPDLVGLRDWAGDVARVRQERRKAGIGNLNGNGIGGVQRQPSQGRKTPPGRSMSLANRNASTSTSSSPRSTVQRLPSPRSNPMIVQLMTPVLSRTQLSSSDDDDFISRFPLPTSSEDADDDYDGTGTDSPSSGSLTFSPKRIRGLRQRSIPKALGLSLDEEPETETEIMTPTKDQPIPIVIERLLQRSSLLSLRILAVVPAVWGICVLLQAFITGGLWHDVWPWGVDLSREALERVVLDGGYEGMWREVSRGDMLLSIAWAICTAHFCFCLTTGLTHRWRSYYSLPSTLTRLLSLQCLCWPATYLTLRFLGAERPLLAWTVIGVTTGGSRAIQMWVTSNVDSEGRGRRWNWDAVAREVGWKVGALLLVTTAWLFWGIEQGRLKRI
ncbi:N-glycosylation protein-domain-containing protein [Naematelia encephala]|uniref:N-glycosylation protein-domain-containing protein n=1 Tax=Naematelia encephala TaxID=71784 RepID=A0A1Y2AUK4_9TREE|nr:N-glycosylation protein-domain-containing protein [Naematelia encephala]